MLKTVHAKITRITISYEGKVQIFYIKREISDIVVETDLQLTNLLYLSIWRPTPRAPEVTRITS